MVNTHHNFCVCETCTYTKRIGRAEVEVTEDLWVTRKGATSAKQGEYGLIPGSMGTGSYVVRGTGESKSWRSCSHGAGRKLSRTKAFSAISQGEFERDVLEAGVVC